MGKRYINLLFGEALTKETASMGRKGNYSANGVSKFRGAFDASKPAVWTRFAVAENVFLKRLSLLVLLFSRIAEKRARSLLSFMRSNLSLREYADLKKFFRRKNF